MSIPNWIPQSIAWGTCCFNLYWTLAIYKERKLLHAAIKDALEAMVIYREVTKRYYAGSQASSSESSSSSNSSSSQQ